MIAELGQLCLCLALMLSLLQAALPLAQRWVMPQRVLHLAKPLATVNFMLVSGAFAALVTSYAMSDFSVLNVVLNSHSAKPMLYKITGSWGNHEGSMLLWAWVLGLFGFLLAYLRAADAALKHATLTVLGMVNAGFLAFLLFTSNPFLRVWPAPLDGEDLNPLLQDIGLALHPPTLYLGYVGFAVVFAHAIAGLWQRRIDSQWAKQVHGWILLPWCFLTLGIGAGSWWAYRELGWGGWWFWDPVENVSLLPWLAGTALLHSNLVLERRGQLARWVVLLAILTFTFSLIGTFIVRSGLITSVHAFAADPARGMFILGYIVLISGGALLLYGWRSLPATAPVHPLSRSGFILLNNILLVAAAGTVLIAILYPVFLELAKLPVVSVGPSYFNRSFLPLTAPLLVLAALAPLTAWDRTTPGQLTKLATQLAPSLLVAALIVLGCFASQFLLATAGIALGCWLLFGSVAYLRRALRARLRLLAPQGMRFVASFLGHVGLAVLVFGITASALLKETYDAPLDAGKTLQFGDYTLQLERAVRQEVENYLTRRATFIVRYKGHYLTELSPELRYYPVRGTQTTEAALYSTPLRDLYLVLGEAAYGEQAGESPLGVRLYVTPGQQWVWLGFLLIAASGALACFAAWRRPIAGAA